MFHPRFTLSQMETLRRLGLAIPPLHQIKQFIANQKRPTMNLFLKITDQGKDGKEKEIVIKGGWFLSLNNLITNLAAWENPVEILKEHLILSLNADRLSQAPCEVPKSHLVKIVF